MLVNGLVRLGMKVTTTPAIERGRCERIRIRGSGSVGGRTGKLATSEFRQVCARM
jgi:hypothetical protein